MLVQCITNDVNNLVDIKVKERLAESIHINGADRSLVVGSIYVVHALSWWNDGGARVYLHTEEESSFPYPYPLEMFCIIDSMFPRNWKARFSKHQNGSIISCFSFHEWVDDEKFYEKLVDDDKIAAEIYRKYR